MFESQISAGATERLPSWEQPQPHTTTWSYDMEDNVKKCVERYCELAKKTTQRCYKVSTPCLDDHHFKEEELESVRELSNVCSRIFLDMFIFGTTLVDIRFVNKFARAVTRWTSACDKRLARLISQFHNTSEFKQYSLMWKIPPNSAGWGCFKVQISQEISKTQSLSGGFCCIFGNHTFVPRSWMCKERSDSHSSTEKEIVSLDAGLRMDGVPTLELLGFDLVLHSSFNSMQRRKRASARRLAALQAVQQNTNFSSQNSVTGQEP